MEKLRILKSVLIDTKGEYSKIAKSKLKEK